MPCNIRSLGRLKENILSLVAMVMDKTKIQRLLRESCSAEPISLNLIGKGKTVFKMEILSKGKGLSVEYFVLKGSCHKESCSLPTAKYYLTAVMNTALFVEVSSTI
jgi:hypothetical protein